jgi:hypothetical protein
MANKQNFTPEEWTKVLQSTMLVGIAVSAADPSGLWGTLKEAATTSSAVIAAKSNAESNELIKAVASAFETPQARSDVQRALKDCFAGAHPTDCVQRSLENLREVSKILDAKAPATRLPSRPGFAASVRKCRGRFGGKLPGLWRCSHKRYRESDSRRHCQSPGHNRLGLAPQQALRQQQSHRRKLPWPDGMSRRTPVKPRLHPDGIPPALLTPRR